MNNQACPEHFEQSLNKHCVGSAEIGLNVVSDLGRKAVVYYED